MRLFPALGFIVAMLVPGSLPAAAQTDDAPADLAVADVAALNDALRIDDLMAVMREEGLASGETLAKDMLPDGPSARWDAIIDRIYDPARMQATFEARFAAEIGDDPAAVAAALAFFASEEGAQIVTLEIEARRAMLDDAVNDAARVLAQDMFADDDPRLAVLQDFAEAADLVEQNVVGGLNGNFAFMQGMADAGGPSAQLTEDEMLDDVWAGEREMRAQTVEWLYSYFALAYQPLSDAELADYAAFWRTPEGQSLNAALFAAFDELFTGISRDLGQATARQLLGDDI
jgi:hypothetical protein